MIGPKVIKQSENYRVIERTGETGKYILQRKCGIWRYYGEYKRQSAAVRKMEQLEADTKH